MEYFLEYCDETCNLNGKDIQDTSGIMNTKNLFKFEFLLKDFNDAGKKEN